MPFKTGRCGRPEAGVATQDLGEMRNYLMMKMVLQMDLEGWIEF